MIVVVATAILGILLAAALPRWSTAIRREREEELTFRGMQYAEAIRVFQQRFGRLPTSLDELIENEPRSIRKLWRDPMTESGRWKVLVAPGQQVSGTDDSGDEPGEPATLPGEPREGSAAGDEPSDAGPLEEPESDEEEEIGPIQGVRSRSREESLRVFNGQTRYDRWEFTVDLVPAPQRRPDSGLLTRARSDWVGRPFDRAVAARQGEAPERQLRKRVGDSSR